MNKPASEVEFWANKCAKLESELSASYGRVSAVEKELVSLERRFKSDYRKLQGENARLREALEKILTGRFHVGNDDNGNLFGPPDSVMCRNIARDALASPRQDCVCDGHGKIAQNPGEAWVPCPRCAGATPPKVGDGEALIHPEPAQSESECANCGDTRKVTIFQTRANPEPDHEIPCPLCAHSEPVNTHGVGAKHCGRLGCELCMEAKRKQSEKESTR